MNKISQNAEVRCPNCGFLDAGSYCSNCGAELAYRSRGAFIDFIDSFLKTSEIKSFLRTFFTILRSPIKNTISYYEKGDARLAFNFLGYSATIYFLVAGTKLVLSNASHLTSTIIDTLLFIILVSVSTPIFYSLSIRKSPYKRTFREFLILLSFYWGFSITLGCTIIQVQALVLGPESGLPLLWILVITMYIYVISVLKSFWGISIGNILLNLVISNSIATVAWFISFLLFSIIFNLPIDY